MDIDETKHLAGMTVNERLLHFGLCQTFDAAVESRDISTVVEVLRKAALTEAQALETASAVLSNPTFYGLR
jgi:hypothetical protein